MRTACIAGLNARSRCQANPTLIGVTGSLMVTVSMRLPSSDHGRCTRSDRIATPLPLATMLRTASTELVRTLTLGRCPACSQ